MRTLQRSAVLVRVAAAVLFAVASGVHAQQPLKVKINLGDVSLNKLPFVIAYEEGIYRANGLDVEQQITEGAASVARRNGVAVPEKYILKKGAPPPPVSIGGACPTIVRYTTTLGTPESVIVACTDPMVRSHLVSRGDLTRPEQLKGKRLGYSGNAATTHLAALSFAQAMGWKPGRDIFLVPGASIPILKKGEVDAFVASELYETIAVADGLNDLVDLSEYKMPTAGSSMMVDRTWLRNNQETARRLVKSLVQALAAIKQNKVAAVKAMAVWYGIKDPRLQENFYRKASLLPRKPYPPYDGLKKMVEFFNNPEIQKHKLEDFYDDSYVRQLDSTGYIDSLYR